MIELLEIRLTGIHGSTSLTRLCSPQVRRTVEPSTACVLDDRTGTGAGFTNSSTKESSTSVTRTFSPTPADVQRDWVIIDATDIVLGRLASHAATLLRGKHKPTFAPHMDMGDFVIIVNASKVSLSGTKKTTKMVYRHSGYPGGLSATPFGELLEKDARKAIPADALSRMKTAYQAEGAEPSLTQYGWVAAV